MKEILSYGYSMGEKITKEQPFKAFYRELLRLYEEGNYELSFQLLKENAANFPQEAKDFYYWRMCIAAVLGRQQEALQSFREAVDQGYWFPLTFLEGDDDLILLRSLPEFKVLFEICKKRSNDAKKHAKPIVFVEHPEQQGKTLPLLMALHGNSLNSQKTLLEWRSITSEGWFLAVPQSSQINGYESYVWNDFDLGMKEVQKHFDTLNHIYQLDRQRIVPAGFSMGGGLAIWIALNQAIQTQGFIALAPYLPPEKIAMLSPLLASLKSNSLRGSIIVGEKDLKECIETARKVHNVMLSYNFPCDLKILTGAYHEYPENFASLLSESLAFIEQK